MPGGRYLPSVGFLPPAVGDVTPREVLDRVSTPISEQQVQASAAWAVARVLYGRGRLGADLYDFGTLNGDLILWLVWGYGPWDGLESITLGDTAVPSRITLTHYDGTQTAHDPTLAQLYSATPAQQAAMVYKNLVYTVARVPAGASPGFPAVTAIWRGRKLYDPRNPAHDPDAATTWAYSDNSTLAMADYYRSSTYGMGRAVDWDTVADCADLNDVLIASTKRSRIGLLLDQRRAAGDWAAVLSEYAEVWALDDGATVKFVPDAAADPVMDFEHDAGQIIELEPLQFTRLSDSPNVIEVVWTDTRQVPWREAVATAIADGVAEGSVDVRLSRVQLPGIQDASQAERAAIQRLNKLNLCDLATRLRAPDRAAPVEIGDVVRVTHPSGLTLKAFRVTGKTGEMGDYWLALKEYDPASYSNAVVDTSTTPDTLLPDPSSPPAIASVTMTEENYITRDGTTQTRYRATWDAPEWPWPLSYLVVFSALGVPSIERTVTATEAVSDQVAEGLLYQVQVFAVSRGLAGAPATATETAVGKGLLPGNVPSISAFEVGGEVRVTISAAIDKDLKFYELRYDNGSKTAGVGGETWGTIWAAATFVDATPAASGVGGFITTKSIPVGTWRLLVCALDSVDQYSAIPATKTVTVTLDVNSFLVGNHEYTNPTLSGMAEYSIPGDTTRYFVTEDGVVAATKFPNVASGYTAIAATFHASMVSAITTEAHDFGTALSGSWQGEINSEALSGSKADIISLSNDGSSYTDQAGLSAKANARYGRVKSSASGTSTLKVRLPAVRLRIDAVPRAFDGAITTAASGPTTITLTQAAAKFKNISIAPVGTTACAWSIDNVQVGATPSFDIYTFNPATNAQIARAVRWTAEIV